VTARLGYACDGAVCATTATLCAASGAVSVPIAGGVRAGTASCSGRSVPVSLICGPVGYLTVV
jgi:hypothetical protein